MNRRFFSIVLLAVSAGAVAEISKDEQSVRFSSGDRHVTLIELFTSEGCSSCPPADRWLSGLKHEFGLWTRFVPVAFHVDYWDYIGWQDRFATPQFGARQRQYAREGGVSTVYTPGMFKDGNEWRGWMRGRTTGSDGGDVGDLAIELTDSEISARFNATDSRLGNLTLHVAVLGMNLTSRVNAGENKGRTLGHDFVVLSLVSTELEKNETVYSGQLHLREPRQHTTEKAVVAWVSRGNRQAPIQATGGLIGRTAFR